MVNQHGHHAIAIGIPWDWLHTLYRRRIFGSNFATDMPQRNRIPLEHRERIIRAFEYENEDYILVADTLGVNRSTARSIVARYIREGRIAERPRGGRNNVRVDNEMRDCLNDILNENCLLTLALGYASLQNRGSMNAQSPER